MALIALLAAVACGGTGDGDSGRISVVASFYPVEYFTGRVAGNRAIIIDLVKPGVEPHDFEPTANDIKSVANADVVVHNGLGLEPWLDRALASVTRKDQVVVAAGEAIGTAAVRTGTDEEGVIGPDPHVWLDPRHAVREVEAIRDALKKADPDGASEYQSNADSLIADLNALDQRYAASFASCRLDHFVTAHEAFGYLAERYGLKQIGVTGIEQEEPDPEQLARIVDAIRANNVKFVLTEPGPSPKIAETVAREVGAQVRELDPIEFQVEGDYLAAMERNRTVLREVLECSG
jgi:zinc transport system substrate-binding protein